MTWLRVGIAVCVGLLTVSCASGSVAEVLERIGGEDTLDPVILEPAVPEPAVPESAVPELVPQPGGDSSSDPGDEAPATSFGGPPPPAAAYRAEAAWILDGDSLDIVRLDPAEGERERAEVRLLGINANEGVECFGNAARDALIDRIGRQEVHVVEDGFDQYGRVLAFLWHEGDLVNLWLVDNGFAVARSSFDHEYEELFDAAEEFARVSEIGLWSRSACGAPSDSAVVISALNFDAEGRDNENPNGEWIELTNEGVVPADLTGWVIRDESTRHRFTFDSFVLIPGATVTIRSGCGADAIEPTRSELFWCDETTIWSNSGDSAFVRDASGALVDSYSYASIYDD